MIKLQYISKNRVRIKLDKLRTVYDSDIYLIKVVHQEKQTKIIIDLNKEYLNTEYLPLTYKILKNNLPGIFCSKCFNDGDLPFRIEVRRTETGHLFEHILLEYLCNCKIKKGFKSASYAGETCWNWEKEKRGLFNITVSVGVLENDIFYKALLKSILLFNFILTNGRYQKAPLLNLGLSSRLGLFTGATS